MTVWKTRGHRGDVLEEIILITNEYYKTHKFAVIDKINTPIKVVEIDQSGLITKGYFEKKSSVDFVGLVQGIGIAFDAKETNLKSLPLSNIHKHQIEYMESFSDQGGLSFLIVHFKLYDKYHLITFELLQKYYLNSKEGDRKSIPYSVLDTKYEIKRENNGILNYLPILNEYMEFKKSLNLN